MSRPMPNRRYVSLGADTSNFTGKPFFTGDFARLTVSWSSSASNPSRLTIVGSDEDGFQSTLSSANPTVNTVIWSQLTALTVAGAYVLDPGMRWVMPIRDGISAASMMTVTFAGSW